MYSKGNLAKGEKADIVHIEGDVDHPTNRGTLCPKGSALLDFVHSETRLKYPMIRKPGSDKFERVSWDFALDRIARLMKDDRDKNFIVKNNDGATVNRWPTTGFPVRAAATNETAWCTYKVVRSTGESWRSTTRRVFDTDRRWPVWLNIRSRCDDQLLDGHQEH